MIQRHYCKIKGKKQFEIIIGGDLVLNHFKTIVCHRKIELLTKIHGTNIVNVYIKEKKSTIYCFIVLIVVALYGHNVARFRVETFDILTISNLHAFQALPLFSFCFLSLRLCEWLSNSRVLSIYAWLHSVYVYCVLYGTA